MAARNAREKWLTERSNSAAICSSESLPPRSDPSLSQARFTCHGARPLRFGSVIPAVCHRFGRRAQ